MVDPLPAIFRDWQKRRANENDRPYAILRDGSKEYWVDLERDSAIVKMVCT